MVGVGDVADGVDVLVGGAQPRVGADAVVDRRRPAVVGELDVRLDADADDQRVDVDRRRRRRGPRWRRARARADRRDLHAGAQVDAVLAVEVGEHLGDLGPEHRAAAAGRAPPAGSPRRRAAGRPRPPRARSSRRRRCRSARPPAAARAGRGSRRACAGSGRGRRSRRRSPCAAAVTRSRGPAGVVEPVAAGLQRAARPGRSRSRRWRCAGRSPCSAYQPSSSWTAALRGSALPSRRSLDRGGRSYGAWASSVTSTTSPSWPRSRSWVTRVPAARPPPTTTIGAGLMARP